jgi:hypothetical protein
MRKMSLVFLEVKNIRRLQTKESGIAYEPNWWLLTQINPGKSGEYRAFNSKSIPSKNIFSKIIDLHY